MDAMDQLFELYNRHIDELDQCADELNALYPAASDNMVRRKSREEFEAFVLGPQHEAKREYLLRLLDGHEELLEQLPITLQQFVRQAA